jgi:hypothetical protein
MSQYQAAYSGAYPKGPRREVFPLCQTGIFSGPLGLGGTVYIEPVRQSASGSPTDWSVVDRGILNGSIQWLQPDGGSLYIYVSPDGAVGTFNLCHILYFPGDNATFPFSGLELFGFAARFRLHSAVASNSVVCYLNVRSV